MSHSPRVEGVSPDAQFARMLPRMSGPFRKVWTAISEELQVGDPSKAHALVQELIARKRMGPVDRRCMIALQSALRAVVGLRAAGLPRELDPAHGIGNTFRVRVNPRHISTLQSAFEREVAERGSQATACPNCGAGGSTVGWVRLMDRSIVPNGQFYIDPEAAVASFLPGEDIGSAYANVLVTAALKEMNARAPVLACRACGLRYIGWNRDAELERHYQGSIGIGFELLGRWTYGRAHQFSWSYKQAALPLHLERVLGSMKGQEIYDFGCAEGVMVSILDDLGARVLGSDLDAPKVFYGQNALGLADLSSDADYFWNLAPSSLDVLYAFHSVEHVFSTDAFFDKFAQAVRPGGALAVSVPHISVGADGEVGHMGGSHLVGFERETLAGFFSRHGFEVVDCQLDLGGLPDRQLDPVLGLPDWSAKSGDMTMVGRRSTRP